MKTLPPGASTTLRVGFRTPTSPEQAHHTVVLPTNDPSTPEVVFDLFARSWVGVLPAPQAVDLGRLQPGGVSEATFQLYAPDHQPFAIKTIAVDLPGAHCSEAERAGTKLPVHRLKVGYRAGNQLGSGRGSVRVLTDRSDAPFVDVPVRVQVVGAFTISPDSLRIARHEIGSVVRKTLVLRANESGTRFRVAGVHAVPPWELIDYKTDEGPPGVLILHAGLRFPSGSGDESGELRLDLDAGAGAAFRVPLLIDSWSLPPPQG